MDILVDMDIDMDMDTSVDNVTSTVFQESSYILQNLSTKWDRYYSGMATWYELSLDLE